MNGIYHIDEQRVLPLAMDFEWLRKEGLKHIESLGSKLWTDYNTHDPGITILEALIYVITDLGYRNSFDIKDILANPNGEIINHTFFTAKQILTSSPLTPLDYRKLLIDLDGISNAWFIPTKNKVDKDGYKLPHDAEVNIFINQKEDKLSFSNLNTEGETLKEQLFIRGLNKVKLEFAEDIVFGNLNSTVLEYAVFLNDRWLELIITTGLKTWQDSITAQLKEGVKKMEFKVLLDAIEMHVQFENTTPDQEWVLQIKPKDSSELELIQTAIQNEDGVIANQIIDLLKGKSQRIQQVLNNVYQTLQQNRNIGEDYLCVETINQINIAVCAEIQIEPAANPIEVLTKVQALLDDLFNPMINFYSLQQLLDKGLTSDEIFNGPVLTHGFVDDEELSASGLPNCIRTSDIIAAIMNLDGVKNISNVLLTGVNEEGNGIAGMTNQAWILKLDGETKPRFSTTFSNLQLFKENLPVFINEQNQRLLDEQFQLHLLQKRNLKLSQITSDLEMPKGQYKALNEYYSVQEEFPSCYALGNNQLMPDATEDQKAHTKQLKAYLHFFDQLLADLFNQLYQAKHLFNTDIIQDTYYPAYLDKDVKTGLDYFSKEIYGAQWQSAITELFYTSNEDTFLDRRNRVLDHLMARFGESFSDYTFLLYQVQHDLVVGSDAKKSKYELIEDKTAFLNSYANTSYKRGNAMDYLHAQWNGSLWNFLPFWDTTHRSGFELRTAKLLGIDETALENIFPEDIPQTEWIINTAQGEVKIKVLQPQIDLAEKWDWLQLNISDAEVYSIEKMVKNYSIFLSKDNNRMARVDIAFSSLEEAETMINTILQAISDAMENFYFLEHILLRPFISTHNDTDDLLSVCLQDDCFNPSSLDPYSFKATLVLPGYMSRFRNVSFRKYAEKIFRQEAPAHVLLKICWVGKEDMILFQNAYRDWLEDYRKFRMAHCNGTVSKTISINFLNKHRKLLDALKQLNTIYPEGHLYDCKTSTTTTPIFLGNSSLGTLT